MEEGNPTYTVAIREPLVMRRVQRAGPHFTKYLNKLRNEVGEKLSNASSSEEISTKHHEFEIDTDYLRSLDPKEWKDQDHYHVLGIKKLR